MWWVSGVWVQLLGLQQGRNGPVPSRMPLMFSQVSVSVNSAAGMPLLGDLGGIWGAGPVGEGQEVAVGVVAAALIFISKIWLKLSSCLWCQDRPKGQMCSSQPPVISRTELWRLLKIPKTECMEGSNPDSGIGDLEFGPFELCPGADSRYILYFNDFGNIFYFYIFSLTV